MSCGGSTHANANAAVISRTVKDVNAFLTTVTTQANPDTRTDPKHVEASSTIDAAVVNIEANRRRSEPGSAGANHQLVVLAEHIGFDAAPHVVTEAQMDALEAEGATMLWRGLSGSMHNTAHEYAELFKTGPYYAAHGAHGAGIYTSEDRSEAAFYAVRGGGVLTRMTLTPDARIIDGTDLDNQHVEWMISMSSRIAAADTAGNEKEVTRLLHEQDLLRDRGCWAAYHGWDGFKTVNRDGPVTVILNRGVVIVQDTITESR